MLTVSRPRPIFARNGEAGKTRPQAALSSWAAAAGAPRRVARDHRRTRRVGVVPARGGTPCGREPYRTQAPLRDRHRPLLRGGRGRVPEVTRAPARATRGAPRGDGP